MIQWSLAKQPQVINEITKKKKRAGELRLHHGKVNEGTQGVKATLEVAIMCNPKQLYTFYLGYPCDHP